MDFITALKGGTGLGTSFADTLIKTSRFTPNLASSSGFLKGLKNSFGAWLFQNSDANKITHLDRLGTVLGGAGALYGAYNQQKMAQKNYDLQKDGFTFNKYLANEELNRRKNMENKLQSVWSH